MSLVTNEKIDHAPASTLIGGVPKKDLLVLPFLSLVTVVVMLGTSEMAARSIWPEQAKDACEIRKGDDISFRKNCRSTIKAAEGPWVDNAYNDCGYRTRESCGPKKPGTTRIAVVGSSISFGFQVPYDQSYPALTSRALTKQCGRPVELQSTGAPHNTLLTVYKHFDEALALHPDMVIFTLNPYDVQINDMRPELEGQLDNPIGTTSTPKAPERVSSFKSDILTPLKQSRSIYMLQHQLYMDPATYIKLYLLYGDSGSGYLKNSFSPGWQRNIQNLDSLVAAMARKTEAAHIPLVILTVPAAAQVALQSSAPRIGLDPEAFARQISSVASAHGVQAIDTLPAMAGDDKPMSMFYVVDGHVGPSGQSRIAATLDDQLRSARFPLFAGCFAK